MSFPARRHWKTVTRDHILTPFVSHAINVNAERAGQHFILAVQRPRTAQPVMMSFSEMMKNILIILNNTILNIAFLDLHNRHIPGKFLYSKTKTHLEFVNIVALNSRLRNDHECEKFKRKVGWRIIHFFLENCSVH